MTEHTVKAYDQELHELTQLVSEMGGLAEKQIGDSIDALITRDENLASRVIAADDFVDELQRRIEEVTIHMIGKRQPLAGDLRDIVGALRISIDLERIGDFAKNIGKRVSVFRDNSYPNHMMKRLQRMADLSLVQIKNVLDSYTQHDVAKAVAVWKRDAEIDEMYTSLFRELLTYMMEEPRNITFSTHMLFCAKNIERIGDHATNIAETVHYMVAGVPLKDGRPKGDLSSVATAAFPA
jgi:phosphate transport system protein